MHRVVSVAAAWSVALAAMVRPAGAAVADYLGKPIVAVRLVVEGRESTEAALLSVLETREGQPLSMTDVRESITHLFSLGQFEDVQVDATAMAGGVVVRYDLKPVHPITSIEFSGRVDAPGINEGYMRQALAERGSTSTLIGRAGELTGYLREALAARGYLRANVTSRLQVAHNPDRSSLIFAVDPGPRAIIADVSLAGTLQEPREKFLRDLGLTRGASFQRDALAGRIERYVASQRRKGYYETKVAVVPEVSADGRTVDVAVTADSGPHVSVAFSGDALPGDRRPELVPVEREGSVDEDLLEDSRRDIEDYLRGQGYRDAAAPYTREQSGDELVITFDVRKGPLYRVVRYEIAGNDSMPRDQLDPSLRLRVGSPFTAARLAADVDAIEAVYHRAGYANVRTDSSLEQAAADAQGIAVAIRILVREGARALVGSVRFTGNQSIADATLLQAIV
jgi:outer membrane protein insertion porin family